MPPPSYSPGGAGGAGGGRGGGSSLQGHAASRWRSASAGQSPPPWLSGTYSDSVVADANQVGGGGLDMDVVISLFLIFHLTDRLSVQILTWFFDTPSPEAPFSVYQMALAGKGRRSVVRAQCSCWRNQVQSVLCPLLHF